MSFSEDVIYVYKSQFYYKLVLYIFCCFKIQESKELEGFYYKDNSNNLTYDIKILNVKSCFL